MLGIIIPYYKFTFFEDTLQSLAQQTDKRFNVYIGDDASPENPFKLLEKYQGQFDFVYHRFESNLGGTSLTQQWDRCIALSSREEWLMILGDDDMLGENIVEEFYQNLNIFESKTNLIRFSTIVIKNDKIVGETHKQPEWENAFDSYYRRILGENRSTLSEYIFSKEKFIKYGFYNYPLGWHSDDRAWIEFSENNPIYSINKAIVYIRLSEIHISGREDNIEEKRKANLNFYEFLVNNNLNYFSKEQREIILLKYEKSILEKNDAYFYSHINLLCNYLKIFKIKLIIRFVKKNVKRILYIV